MLGYFHYILVADNYVFDFDLAHDKPVELKSYIRLQFTPPYEPFEIYGINYSENKNPENWELNMYDIKHNLIVTTKFNEFIKFKKVYSLDRDQILKSL